VHFVGSEAMFSVVCGLWGNV